MKFNRCEAEGGNLSPYRQMLIERQQKEEGEAQNDA